MGLQRVGHYWATFNFHFHFQWYNWASLVAQTVKNLPAVQETRRWCLGRKDPGERNGNPLQYSYLENSMKRSLASYSPWGRRVVYNWVTNTFTECIPANHTNTAWQVLLSLFLWWENWGQPTFTVRLVWIQCLTSTHKHKCWLFWASETLWLFDM